MAEQGTGVSSDETNTDESERVEGPVFTGVCRGGPLDGQSAESRFPGGFVLIDKPGDRAWIYDHSADQGVFWVRTEDPMPYNPAKGLDAALGHEYDVRALPEDDTDGGG